jgi:hypothetical protein
MIIVLTPEEEDMLIGTGAPGRDRRAWLMLAQVREGEQDAEPKGDAMRSDFDPRCPHCGRAYVLIILPAQEVSARRISQPTPD